MPPSYEDKVIELINRVEISHRDLHAHAIAQMLFLQPLILNNSLHKPPELRGLTLQNQKSVVTQPCRKITEIPAPFCEGLKLKCFGLLTSFTNQLSKMLV